MRSHPAPFGWTSRGEVGIGDPQAPDNPSLGSARNSGVKAKGGEPGSDSVAGPGPPGGPVLGCHAPAGDVLKLNPVISQGIQNRFQPGGFEHPEHAPRGPVIHHCESFVAEERRGGVSPGRNSVHPPGRPRRVGLVGRLPRPRPGVGSGGWRGVARSPSGAQRFVIFAARARVSEGAEGIVDGRHARLSGGADIAIRMPLLGLNATAPLQVFGRSFQRRAQDRVEVIPIDSVREAHLVSLKVRRAASPNGGDTIQQRLAPVGALGPRSPRRLTRDPAPS